MVGATYVVKRLGFAGLVDDHIGLVKRLMAIEGNREQLELILVLYVGIVANPSRIELPRKQNAVIS